MPSFLQIVLILRLTIQLISSPIDMVVKPTLNRNAIIGGIISNREYSPMFWAIDRMMNTAQIILFTVSE